jgi:hypothetical protein
VKFDLMIWTISQFPELDHLTPDQRAALLKNLPRWTYWVIVARSLALAFLVSGISISVTLRSFPPEVLIVTHILLVALVATAYYLSQMRDLRRLMRNEIANGFRGQRPPFCFSCGYDLRASGAPLCPECGRETKTF